MNTKRWLTLPYILALMALLLGACGGSPAGGTSVWLDVPLDGLKFSSLQEIKIEGHAASTGGISRVEVWVNGAVFTTINDPPLEGTLANFHTAWMPAAAGEYIIQAIAYGADGTTSQADFARIAFGDITPTPMTPQGITDTPITPTPATETLTPTATPTVPPPPGAVVQFWADPDKIEAGACTTIHWHADNVQKVIFGGKEQPLDGSYKDCLCKDERYTLKVMKQDGTEEKYKVDIRVKGQCVTPEAPNPPAPATGDTTAPPAPSPRVPADGLTVPCKAKQSLVWLPVEDASGIAKYGVQVQRHAGDNNWQAAPGGNQGVVGKTTTIPVECGWYYRWRVRAVDGAGNEGPWSGWSSFAVPLTEGGGYEKDRLFTLGVVGRAARDRFALHCRRWAVLLSGTRQGIQLAAPGFDPFAGQS